MGELYPRAGRGVKETIRWKTIRFFDWMQNGIINWLDTHVEGGVKKSFRARRGYSMTFPPPGGLGGRWECRNIMKKC